MNKFSFFLIGAVVAVLVCVGYSAVNKMYIKDDDVDADDVFNEYIGERTQDSVDLVIQISNITDFVQSLDNCKTFIDSLKLVPITLSGNASAKDAANQILLAGSTMLSNRYKMSGFLNLDSNSANFEINRAASKVRFAVNNEFAFYDQLANVPSFLPESQSKQIIAQYNDQVAFANHKSTISNAIAKQINVLNSIVLANKAKVDDLSKKILKTKGTEKQTTSNSRDKLLITMVIPIFAFSLVIVVFVLYLLRENNEMIDKILDDKILIQVFTIFILVISILLLGIGGKLSGETLGTLLGGISVYVLQKSLEPKPSAGTPPGSPPGTPPVR
jgi:hypothetical protein